MRILEVLGSSGGGVVRHVGSLAAGLLAAGDRVVVAGPAATLDRGGIDGVPVEIADRPHPVADARAVLAMRRLAAAADLVHAHGLRAGALAVIAVRTRRDRPRLAVTLHNLPVGGGVVAAVTWVLERVVARGADDVLVVSPDLGVRARARGARRVVHALVPAPPRSAVEPGARRAVREELGVADEAFLIVTPARLAPQKGLSLLTDALWLLRAREGGRTVTAVIAGDGPQRASLEADAAERRLPLRLLGDRDDVPRLLAAADAAVLPSVWEGQSLAVQEALRAGVPIVATDVGGNRELTRDAAVLIPRTTPEASARALAEAVAQLADSPELVADLRRRSLERALEMPTQADAVRQVRQLLRGPRT